VAAVVVLAGVGVLAFFLFRGDDGGSTTAASSSTSTSTSASSRTSSAPAMDGGSGMGSGGALPGGASNPPSNPGGSMSTDAPSGGSSCRYDGCNQVAAAWLSALLQGNDDSAFQLSCAELQQAATRGSQGSGTTPAGYLAGYFFSKTLGGQGFTDGTLTDVAFDSGSGYDLVKADLTLEDGTTQTVTVAVDSDSLVCDWG
jgi:hypothetical protein